MLDDFGVPDFMLRALIAGMGIAVIAGSLGVFVVWRRMAYFGEAMAHSSLLGVVLGVALGVMPWVTVMIVSALVAVLLFVMERSGRATMDSAIGVIAHGSLAVGLVILAFLDNRQISLFSYLFGDILATTTGDLWLTGAGVIGVLGVLYGLWNNLLSVVVNEELAQVEGVSVTRTKIIHLLLLSVTIALAMKVVGVLMIVALLIVPASAARNIARSPENMAVLAVGIGCLSVIFGLGLAYYHDTPAGPSIAATSVVLFLVSMIARWRPVRMRR